MQNSPHTKNLSTSQLSFLFNMVLKKNQKASVKCSSGSTLNLIAQLHNIAAL